MRQHLIVCKIKILLPTPIQVIYFLFERENLIDQFLKTHTILDQQKIKF